MVRAEIEITNALGLHARASAQFTRLASRFKSHIWAENDRGRINAKSIMGVMMLAAKQGSFITIEAQGPDEQQAIDAMFRLVADKFGEEA